MPVQANLRIPPASMGKKRPHPGAESSGNDVEGAAKKRHRTNRGPKARPKNPADDSFNGIKKRARAIERLLARDNLKIPANKQNELERELAAHKERIAEARAKKERSKMIQKYHMVRFFGMSSRICAGVLLSYLITSGREEEGNEAGEAAREEAGANHRSG